MIDSIYIENAVAGHPATQRILAAIPRAHRIPCDRYAEVFNRRAQNFRLQKLRPALILAEKKGNLALPAPPGYGIGGTHGFYFSHMLNCIYDCRYCFLQGMFRSANYVLFVNYEDFADAIAATAGRLPDVARPVFFSGYDCDSFALEAITGFVAHFLPFFQCRPALTLELRTKSLATARLLQYPPIDNVVVAFSLTPDPVSRALEHKVPALSRRLELIAKLAAAGWPIGLRFDPLIDHAEFERNYLALFDSVFQLVPAQAIHSVTYGSLRFPESMFRTVARLYPEEPLFASDFANDSGMIAYPPHREQYLIDFCRHHLAGRVPPARLFHQSF